MADSRPPHPSMPILPHTKSWVHVGDMPVGLHFTRTAVLPTGDLIVMGSGGAWYGTSTESCVYKTSLKFNGNSEL